jgi:hypothetical protein
MLHGAGAGIHHSICHLRSSSPPLELDEIRGEQPAAAKILGDPHGYGEVLGVPRGQRGLWGAADV